MAAVSAPAAPAAPARTPPSARARQRNRVRRLPLLPALLFTVVVTQVPFLLTIWYSLQSWNLLHPLTKHFTGLSNYQYIFTDPTFRTDRFRAAASGAVGQSD